MTDRRMFPCPVKGCAEVWVEPERDDPQDAAGVALALGMPPEAFAATRHHQALEGLSREMGRHLDGHTSTEWAATTREVTDLLRNLTRAVSRHACENVDPEIIVTLRPALDYLRELDTRSVTALVSAMRDGS